MEGVRLAWAACFSHAGQHENNIFMVGVYRPFALGFSQPLRK
jgi:hypothetical protein